MTNKTISALLLVVLILGCASPGEMAGNHGPPLERLLVSLGTPTFELKLPNGRTRRFYHDDISFVHTWRADFDVNGKLVDIAPATTSTEYGEVVPHVTTRNEIVARFGLPYSSSNASDGSGASATYEFAQYGSWPVWVRFSFDRNGVLIKSDVERIRDRGRKFSESVPEAIE